MHNNIPQCQDISQDWRCAIVYVFSPVFKKYCAIDSSFITIRPGESARRQEVAWAKKYNYQPENVYFHCPGE